MRLPILIFLLISLISLSAQSDKVPCPLEKDIIDFAAEYPSRYQQGKTKFNSFKNQHAVPQKKSGDDPCPNGITIIPIAFHIFHDGESIGQGYNFSAADLVKVVVQLNEDFSGYNAKRSSIPRDFKPLDGGHSCIQFAVGKINRINKVNCAFAKTGANHEALNNCLPGGSGPGSENDPNDYLNIYSTDLANGFLGIASCIPNLYGRCNTNSDGVSIHRDIIIPGSSTKSNQNRGGVLSHEIGHWLGLPHVNGDVKGGGCSGDDGFEDTFPQISQRYYSCSENTLPISCQTPDNVYNFMDYGDDCVKLMFTSEQSAMMNAVMRTNREYLSKSVKRGNYNSTLYDLNNQKTLKATSPKFDIVNAQCYTDLNLLGYMNKWYPQGDSTHTQSGLTIFYWTINTGTQITMISGLELASYSISHRDLYNSEVTVLHLRKKQWDPISQKYSEEELAGTILVVINDCGIPKNDKIENALQLDKSNCNEGRYYINSATPSDFENLECRNNEFNKDVWFKLIVPASGAIQLEVYRLHDKAKAPRMQLFSKLPFTHTRMFCQSRRPSSFIKKYDLTPFDTLYIRVINVDDLNDRGVFGICLSEPALRNDDCITSTSLDVQTTCTPIIGNNIGAYISKVPSFYFGCGDGQVANDIWYALRIPASGKVSIETFKTEGGISGTIMEAFLGTCNSLKSIACNNGKSYYPEYDDHAKIELYNIPAGEILYIRMAATGRVQEGNFAICAYEPEEIPKECSISKIDLGEQIQCDPLTNTFGQEFIIYYTSTDSSGSLLINDESFPLTGSPQTVTLYDLPSNNQWMDIIANITSETDQSCWQHSFYYSKNNFQAPQNCIVYGPVNDECVGAILLVPTKDLEIDTFDNIGATWSEYMSEEYACGNSGLLPEDVWFKTIIPLTGGVDISLPLFYNENNMILEVYKGDCGNLELIACDQFGQLWGSSVRIINEKPGDTIYIRVADQGSNTQDIFGISILEYTTARSEDPMSTNRSSHIDGKSTPTWNFSIGPNPANDFISIQVSDNVSANEQSLKIYDLNGKVYYKNQLSAHQKTIRFPITDWPSGIYFVSLQSETGSFKTKKVVISH